MRRAGRRIGWSNPTRRLNDYATDPRGTSPIHSPQALAPVVYVEFVSQNRGSIHDALGSAVELATDVGGKEKVMIYPESVRHDWACSMRSRRYRRWISIGGKDPFMRTLHKCRALGMSIIQGGKPGMEWRFWPRQSRCERLSYGGEIKASIGINASHAGHGR